METKADFGLIGLAVMGQNLVLNVESRGYRVSVYNRTTSVMEEFVAQRGEGKQIAGYSELADFVESLERPRKMMLMVQAGRPVDAVIEALLPLLAEGDIIIDGGNSHFPDTERRAAEVVEKGFRYLGVGVSGGEEGALHGPSIMPGGDREAWELVRPIFEKIAAQVEGEPCCRYMGPGGAGHFVKMVHNGIEYGDMQLISEAYAFLKTLPGVDAPRLQEIFSRWNQGELESYLIEITAQIFGVRDEKTGEPLVEMILDKAGQKGTGRWTLLAAAEHGSVISTINAAVEARILSSWKGLREEAAKVFDPPHTDPLPGEALEWVDSVHDALLGAKILSYAQGMELLQRASEEHDWNLPLSDIAAIWRGGCIIRARFLGEIMKAYDNQRDLPNLLFSPYFKDTMVRAHSSLRSVVAAAVMQGIAVPAFSASLGYFDSFRSARLPANLLQAQRDFFGAHTYERIDGEGHFHTEWLEASS